MVVRYLSLSHVTLTSTAVIVSVSLSVLGQGGHADGHAMVGCDTHHTATAAAVAGGTAGHAVAAAGDR